MYNAFKEYFPSVTKVDIGNLLIQVPSAYQYHILMKMKNSKSTDFDTIGIEILKQDIYFIIAPLSYIVDQSFLIGMFPNCLKANKVILVYKNRVSKKIQKSFKKPLAKVFFKLEKLS